MSVNSYEELKQHIGHDIVCVFYGKDRKNPANVSVECHSCYEVIMEYDRPERGGGGRSQLANIPLQAEEGKIMDGGLQVVGVYLLTPRQALESISCGHRALLEAGTPQERKPCNLK